MDEGYFATCVLFKVDPHLSLGYVLHMRHQVNELENYYINKWYAMYSPFRDREHDPTRKGRGENDSNRRKHV